MLVFLFYGRILVLIDGGIVFGFDANYWFFLWVDGGAMSGTTLRTTVLLLGAVVYACFGPRVHCFMCGFALLLARMVVASVSGG
ncbi:hypothetical protein A2U01_0067071, partial [Trifolium medium]|nr:hypothetical protein [Trifolium medium]